MSEHSADKDAPTCRRCGLTARAAIAGVLCEPPYAGSHDFPAVGCDHCGHVRGLHGRNHGCISAFADGVPGKSCGCPGYVTPSAVTEDPS